MTNIHYEAARKINDVDIVSCRTANVRQCVILSSFIAWVANKLDLWSLSDLSMRCIRGFNCDKPLGACNIFSQTD